MGNIAVAALLCFPCAIGSVLRSEDMVMSADQAGKGSSDGAKQNPVTQLQVYINVGNRWSQMLAGGSIFMQENHSQITGCSHCFTKYTVVQGPVFGVSGSGKVQIPPSSFCACQTTLFCNGGAFLGFFAYLNPDPDYTEFFLSSANESIYAQYCMGKAAMWQAAGATQPPTPLPTTSSPTQPPTLAPTPSSQIWCNGQKSLSALSYVTGPPPQGVTGCSHCSTLMTVVQGPVFGVSGTGIVKIPPLSFCACQTQLSCGGANVFFAYLNADPDYTEFYLLSANESMYQEFCVARKSWQLSPAAR